MTTVNFKDIDALKKQRDEHPLTARRQEAELAFLQEVTALSRKYGLAFEVNTWSEYGENYSALTITNACGGTEAYYHVGGGWNENLQWQSGPNSPACAKAEREQMKIAQKLRHEEAEYLGKINGDISRASWEAFEEGHRRQMDAMMAEYAKEPKPKPVCACGKEFKTEKSLAKHREETGHGDGTC